jgi:YHS domain-containing protein
MTIRNAFIFLGTFAVGALIALVVRAASFAPHADQKGHPAGGGEYAGMVSNPLVPAQAAENKSAAEVIPPATKGVTADPHANHQAAAEKDPANKTVNTVCAICGMPVDSNLPTLEYQGKTIGFGCKLCAPKFKADPERYGPVYLKNEVIKR